MPREDLHWSEKFVDEGQFHSTAVKSTNELVIIVNKTKYIILD